MVFAAGYYWIVLAEAQGSPFVNPMVLMVLMLVVFYLIVWRPESQRRKAHQAMLNNLKKHDRVVTVAGIKGIVTQTSPDFVTLRIDEKNNVDIEVTLSSIVKILTTEGEKTPTTPP